MNEKSLQKDYAAIRPLFEKTFGLILPEKLTKSASNGFCQLLENTSISNIRTKFENFGKHNLAPEISELIKLFTVNHTYFFRENAHFEFLKNEAIPQLIDNSYFLKQKEIRLWSAACASGEEAYSILLTLLDQLDGNGEKLHFRILATDIDVYSLNAAVKGLYCESELSKISETDKHRFFIPFNEKSLIVKNEFKGHILFRWLNLNAPVYPMQRKFHIIFCRNVLLYLSNESRDRLISKLCKYLYPGGYLFIGQSEVSNLQDDSVTSLGSSVFRKK